jgi:hypothetical protein
VTVPALVLLVGLPYYAVVIRHRDDAPRHEHAAAIASTKAVDEPGLPPTPSVKSS